MSAGTVLITGAGNGLGYELTAAYLDSGWQVFALARHASERLSDLASRFPASLVCAHVDLASDRVEGELQRLFSGHHRLDLVINNAGVPGRGRTLRTADADELRELFEVHAVACFRVTKAVLDQLLASSSGHIVNVSSRAASLAKNANRDFADFGFTYSYRMAKAAQNMLSVVLAEELAPHGIRVSAIHPGRFLSGSVHDHAGMTARQAARRLQEWIAARGPEPIVFAEPGGGPLPW